MEGLNIAKLFVLSPESLTGLDSVKGFHLVGGFRKYDEQERRAWALRFCLCQFSKNSVSDMNAKESHQRSYFRGLLIFELAIRAGSDYPAHLLWSKIMNISNARLQLIKTSEGFRSSVYVDVAGFPTIGYGQKLNPGESYPSGITEAQATTLLDKDVTWAENVVDLLVKVSLTQGRYDALVDFTFNLGGSRLASRTLLKFLNASQYDVAGHQLLSWDHSGGVVVAGLKARRETESQLWNG
jgi:lysozyme